MTAVLGIRIKTSDLVAHIAGDAELSARISNVPGTDGFEHVEAAVRLMRDIDKLTLIAPGVADLLDGSFEISPDGSMTFYDAATMELAWETLHAACQEADRDERPICASLGIAESHAISQVRDITGLLDGLMDYHEELVLGQITEDLFAKTLRLRAQEQQDEGDARDDEGENQPYVKPQPAEPGEITGYAEVISVRTGSAGMAVEVSIALMGGEARTVTFTGDDAAQALQAITALEGTYATTRVRVGEGGRALAFAIAVEDIDVPPFLDH